MEKQNQPVKLITDRVIMTILSIGYQKQMNVTLLSRDVGVTYAHMSNRLIPLLLSWGCITDHKFGRERIIILSRRGAEVYKRLKEIGEILNGELK